jgi:hypothetical protein
MPALFARPDTAAADTPRDGRRDFDWLDGRWSVSHRKLRKRLVGDTDWAEFDGWSEVRPIVGGLAHADDNLLETPAGPYRGGGLKLFDPTTRLWSIWWIDSRFPTLEPPVQGRFEAGIGTFLGDDSWEGTPIIVRYIWSEITDRSARWQQAFSTDAGASWETNWDMRFTRIAA